MVFLHCCILIEIGYVVAIGEGGLVYLFCGCLIVCVQLFVIAFLCDANEMLKIILFSVS